MSTEHATGYCLNCETALQGKFCHACGQKASTHRISFKKFVEHDLVHGIFHLDRGILFTLQALFLIPGHAARRYLDGKRVKHYNIFALFLIVAALKTVIDSKTVVNSFVATENGVLDAELNQTLRNYYKLIYLLYIPVLAFLSLLLFRHMRYNFAEHMVAAAFALTSGLICALIISLIGFLLHDQDFVFWGYVFSIVYLMFPYYQISKTHYRFWNYLWRALLMISFVAFLLIVGLMATLVIVYGKFEGQVGIRVGN